MIQFTSFYCLNGIHNSYRFNIYHNWHKNVAYLRLLIQMVYCIGVEKGEM